jgi:Ni/Fe-hydrogenase subunit HybB-like protein
MSVGWLVVIGLVAVFVIVVFVAIKGYPKDGSF